MLTFNPGPSKLSDQTKENIKKAITKNIPEISHRSEAFSYFSKQAIESLRQYFKIPKDYKIFYTNSASEAMQLCISNCCEKNSFHFVNGNFSNQFYKISKSLRKEAIKDEVKYGKQNNFKETKILNNTELITITHNETSTGSTYTNQDIKYIKQNNPDKLLAIDITSSAGCYKHDFSDADLWLFSVQKCFGLPAGLGILIVSPNTYQKSTTNKNNLAGYFSFENMWKKMENKYQTVCTPNVLNIYLLSHLIKLWNSSGGIEQNIKTTQEKYKLLEDLIQQKENLNYFTKNKNNRSLTTICLESTPEKITKLHELAKINNITIGKGYGRLKPNTFRIANFPAHTQEDFQKLTELLNTIF